ncbi:beta-lactamase/transpeptidase-like protein [Poronia punctata]|nr:beta-lactamase/transpeptidase-like protein [Poronia punctata]
MAKYLPELKDEDSLIDWGSITLRHLADQVADIPANYGFSEYYYLKEYFESLGFPHTKDDDYASCGIIGLNGICTREQFLKGMTQSYPIAQPAERPVYSNIAFTLLMYAVEAKTGQNYTSLLETFLTEPLGLKNTKPSPGDDDSAVIPPGESTWGSDYGDNAPGGGLVSTLSDLSIFLHRILTHTALTSSTADRSWMKPTSSTGSLNSLVGTPWEIYRTAALTPAHSHVVDIYGKGGAAAGYQSQIGVIDEYGAAVIILTAGDALAVKPLYDAVLATFVPALDEIAREQVGEKGYVGTFGAGAGAGVDGECTDDEVAKFNIAIVQDSDSLILESVERNGTEIMDSLKEIWSVTLGTYVPLKPIRARIYPVDIRKEEKKVIREDWRLDWEFESSGKTELPGAGLSDGNCLGWTLTDWIYYGSEPLDRMVFVRDAESGDVIGLEIPYLRSGVLKPVGTLET